MTPLFRAAALALLAAAACAGATDPVDAGPTLRLRLTPDSVSTLVRSSVNVVGKVERVRGAVVDSEVEMSVIVRDTLVAAVTRSIGGRPVYYVDTRVRGRTWLVATASVSGMTLVDSIRLVVVGGTSSPPLTSVGRVTGGYSHTCALSLDGSAYCWGANGSGALGDSSGEIYGRRPSGVAGNLTFSTIGAGGSQTCGLTTSGAAYCWGYGDAGQLGNGPSIGRGRRPSWAVSSSRSSPPVRRMHAV